MRVSLIGLLLIGVTLTLSSCTVLGPDYQSPTFDSPPNYKQKTSSQHGVSHEWWRAFQDKKLNSLQERLLANNKSLAVAAASYEQSLAALAVTRSSKAARIRGTGFANRNEITSNDRFEGSGDNFFTLYNVNLNLDYELDLWGRVKRLIEASDADAQASAAALEDVLVTLQTQLARDYFALRSIDSEKAVLNDAVTSRKESLTLAQERLEAGFVSELDPSRAKSELAIAQAELSSLTGPRAALENAIAVLVGSHPSSFRISPIRYKGVIPTIPSGVPGELLARRPDIAAVERQLAASSARIGVAQAAFFPTIRLTGQGGLSSINTGDFLDSTSRNWTIGPNIEIPIFGGSILTGRLKAAKDRQQEDLARFQQTALTAFAEVENGLAQVHSLKEESQARAATVKASRNTFELAQLRYSEGADDYLTVIDSHRVLLNAERTAVQTRGRQFAATIQLIQALGGGFKR